MPNGALSNGKIRNFSKEMLRRTDITLSVNHNSDIVLVKSEILDTLKADKRILELPEPLILVKDITAEAVLFSVLAWTTNADYGFVVSDFYQVIKKPSQETKSKFPHLKQKSP